MTQATSPYTRAAVLAHRRKQVKLEKVVKLIQQENITMDELTEYIRSRQSTTALINARRTQRDGRQRAVYANRTRWQRQKDNLASFKTHREEVAEQSKSVSLDFLGGDE
jgi:hypothetical protein